MREPLPSAALREKLLPNKRPERHFIMGTGVLPGNEAKPNLDQEMEEPSRTTKTSTSEAQICHDGSTESTTSSTTTSTLDSSQSDSGGTKEASKRTGRVLHPVPPAHLVIPPSEIDLHEVVGVGGYGEVRRATYRGRDVAVKGLKVDAILTKAHEDLIWEAKNCAHLSHPNICALIGIVMVEGVHLVLEYVRGGTLSDAIHMREAAVPHDVILDWATQIAVGMNYLHNEANPPLLHSNLNSRSSEYFFIVLCCCCVC